VLVSGTVGFRLRKLTPLQEGIFHSIGYGYRSLSALQGLFYLFGPDVIARDLHGLYKANLIDISAELREVRFSAAMAAFLEACLTGRDVRVDVEGVPADEPLVIGDYRLIGEVFEQLGIEAPGELVTKIEVVILPDGCSSGTELERASQALEVVSQGSDGAVSRG
jgi:hypothetical protein